MKLKNMNDFTGHRIAKQIFVLIFDVLLVIFSVWIAYYLRLGDLIPLWKATNEYLPPNALSLSVTLAVPTFVIFGLYKPVFRFGGYAGQSKVVLAGLVYGLIFSSTVVFIGVAGVPRTIGLIQPVVLTLMILASRAFVEFGFRLLSKKNILFKKNKVLIYGAGSVGREIAAALSNNPEYKVIGFLDQEKSIQGLSLGNLKVYDPKDLAKLISRHGVSEVLLTMTEMSAGKTKAVAEYLKQFDVRVTSVPGFSDLIKGKLNVADIYDVNIDDVLGRKVVTPDPKLLSGDIEDKVVLITGAGGSIGSELARQIIRLKPNMIVLLEQNEFALYKIEKDLIDIAQLESLPILISAELGSVTDQQWISKTLSKYKPSTIYHAAALKHVPLVEKNPLEAVKTNVFGTMCIASTAIAQRTPKFVFISTDKAVRPTNVMGATKRVAELLLQQISQKAEGTNFAMVRFGNVLGSSGSVVPLFKKQIANGGPVTVTHKDITRFFMTISEAAQLVIQAGAMRNETENSWSSSPIYLLDMGQPVKIFDVAKLMIELSGRRVATDVDEEDSIAIEIIGLRPGEKLFEELLVDESSAATAHPKIMVATEAQPNEQVVQLLLSSLWSAVENLDNKKAVSALIEAQILAPRN